MKRKLTWDEVQVIIKQEDECGVNNLLQEILSHTKDNKVVLGKDIEVMGEIDKRGLIGAVEVIKCLK